MAYKKPRAGKGSTHHQRFHHLDPTRAVSTDPPPEHLVSPLDTIPVRLTAIPQRDIDWARHRHTQDPLPNPSLRMVYQFLPPSHCILANGWLGYPSW